LSVPDSLKLVRHKDKYFYYKELSIHDMDIQVKRHFTHFRQGKSPNMTTACQPRVQIACSFSAQEALCTKPGISLQFPVPD
jgi:hypothetical protein